MSQDNIFCMLVRVISFFSFENLVKPSNKGLRARDNRPVACTTLFIAVLAHMDNVK